MNKKCNIRKCNEVELDKNIKDNEWSLHDHWEITYHPLINVQPQARNVQDDLQCSCEECVECLKKIIWPSETFHKIVHAILFEFQPLCKNKCLEYQVHPKQTEKI